MVAYFFWATLYIRCEVTHWGTASSGLTLHTGPRLIRPTGTMNSGVTRNSGGGATNDLSQETPPRSQAKGTLLRSTPSFNI